MFLERCNDVTVLDDLTSPIGRAAENSHRQGPKVCPSRQARDFEAVTGLTNIAILTIHLRRKQRQIPCSRMEGAGKPRHRSQNPRDEGESAGSDRNQSLRGFRLPYSPRFSSMRAVARFPDAHRGRPSALRRRVAPGQSRRSDRCLASSSLADELQYRLVIERFCEKGESSRIECGVAH